jgi:hypothetical protein
MAVHPHLLIRIVMDVSPESDVGVEAHGVGVLVWVCE